MKERLTIVALAATLTGVLLATGCGNVPATVRAAQPTTDSNPAPTLPFASEKKPSPTPEKELTVPTGTLVSVRLQQMVSSASARPGEEFAAVLAEPLVSDGKTIAP